MPGATTITAEQLAATALKAKVTVTDGMRTERHDLDQVVRAAKFLDERTVAQNPFKALGFAQVRKGEL